MRRVLLKYIRFFNKTAWMFFLLFFDLLAFYSAIFLNQIISNPLSFNFYKNPLLLIKSTLPLLAIIVPIIAYHGIYTKRLSLWDEIKQILKVVGFLFLVVVLIFVSQKDGFNNKLILLFFQFILPLMLFLAIYRIYGKKILYNFGIGKEKIIIIGAGNAGISVLTGLRNEKHLGYEVIGFLDDDKMKHGLQIEGVKVFGGIRHLTKFSNKLEIDTVIIAIPTLPMEKLVKLTNSVQKYTKRIFLIPDLKGVALLNTELYHLFTQQVFLLEIHNNLKLPLNTFMKKAFDITLSLIFLPIILAIVGIIGILIKLDSQGPVFLTQKRLGKNKTVFNCLKFRTMYINSDEILENYLEKNVYLLEEWNKYKKLRNNDPRVTKIGRFLRKTSLDELPQIYNVLKGEMSLFGPRPYLPNEEEDMKGYTETIFLIKPGITGLWQVSGRNNVEFKDRLKLDSWYILNWSLWLDIVILFKTIKVVLKREGAY